MNEMLLRPGELKADITTERFIERYICHGLDDAVISQDLSVKFTVSLFDDEILVNGSIEGSLMPKCVRCLNDFKLPISIPLVLSYPMGKEDINIEPEIRDLLILSLPESPVCREECSGLCQVCGTDLNKNKCSCVISNPSPRWEELKKIAEKLGGKNAKSKT